MASEHDQRPELHEDVELDVERRRYLLDVHDQLGTITHYALLGVSATADAKALKNAYYRLAGLVHPDRYFGKRLGTYKAKMEAIFAQLSEAHETLSSPERRSAYDAALREVAEDARASGRMQAAPAAAPVDPRLVAKREAARAQLEQHFAAGKAKARQYAEAAVRAMAKGDVTAAAEAYRSALTFAPGDAELRRAYQETERAAGQRLADSHVKKALLEERFGRWAAAAESWQRAMATRPDDPELQARLANALARVSQSER